LTDRVQRVGMSDELLLYGSYGYTGALIAETAADADVSPVIAGRDAEALEAQAMEHGLDHLTFRLDHPPIVDEYVREFDAVLNCAGPFSATARPLAGACIRTGTDYLDIAGQIDVLEATADRGDAAAEAGVTLLSGVGFDVVPTDCLAVHLAERIEDPTRLRLAIDGMRTFSPGTAKSMIESLDRPGAVREGGVIRTVPMAWKTREFEFGTEDGPKEAVTIPWGDVSTAYRATGIPDVETYATVPRIARWAMERARPLAPVLGSKPVQGVLKAIAGAAVSGPSESERAQTLTRIVGEVENRAGDRAAARMRTPDPYDVTARTAVEAARRVLAGEVDAGAPTPGEAFGPDYALEFPGVERRPI
jgi:short subunit dehydrogenase-like uncharacterized protein